MLGQRDHLPEGIGDVSEHQEFEIVDRTAVDRDTWDAIAENSPEAWLWHRYDVCESLGRWRDATDVSFALFERSEPVAIVPLRVISYRRLRLFRACDLESMGGIAIVPGLGRRGERRARRYALEAVLRRGQASVMQLRILVPPLAPALLSPDAPRVNPLLQLGLENALTQTWLVDLIDGADAAWAGLEGRARTAIRKAERSGITVRLADSSDDDLGAYMSLHADTCVRNGIPEHPVGYFETIWERLIPPGLARVFFAENEGKVIAARNFGVYKRAASTWTAASSQEAGPIGANALLQWEAMRTLADEGLEVMDCGEAFPAAPEAKLRDLSAFKQSFGGILHPYYKGRLDLRSRWIRRYDALRS
jgi:hypothetical protein